LVIIDAGSGPISMMTNRFAIIDSSARPGFHAGAAKKTGRVSPTQQTLRP
jgi:hypothetical protein